MTPCAGINRIRFKGFEARTSSQPPSGSTPVYTQTIPKPKGLVKYLMTKTERFLSSIRPYPVQVAFFEAREKRIAYGGARGGGKSYAMRKKLCMLALKYPGIQILLLRRTLPELRENHINPLRRELKGLASYRESTKEFTFRNQSRIKLGYLAADSDVLQYQGQAYEVIGMEEATQFSEEQYLALTECNRLSGNLKVDFVPRMYFTCNPGGVGHAWVKRLFIDCSYREGERKEDYRFIPAHVWDNEYIMQKNPDYVKALQALPPIRRQAMLHGNWDVFEGQFFPEFDREKHACDPFEIPEDWGCFAAFDYGLDRTACLWLAYPPDKSHLYVCREFCQSDLILSRAAEEIHNRNNSPAARFFLAPPDLAGRRQESGRGGFDILTSAGLSHLNRAENARISGWRRVREFLQTKAVDGTPFLQIFSTCTELLHCLPKLQFDKNVPEDAAISPHEYTHAPDALRYALLSAPFLPFSREKAEKVQKKTLAEEFFGKRHTDYYSFLSE